jgi:ankyrin repeat protein
MLKHGAYIHHQEPDGTTALMRATRNGHVDVVNLLLDHDAKIHQQNEKGSTVIQNLLDRRAHIDHQRHDGKNRIIASIVLGTF